MKMNVWAVFCGVALLSSCASRAPVVPPEQRGSIDDCMAGGTLQIYTLPSRGFIADRLAIGAVRSSGNDGGFSDHVRQLFGSGVRAITFQSNSSAKLSAYLEHAFSRYREGELDGVDVCFVGDPELALEVAPVIERTGARFHIIPK